MLGTSSEEKKNQQLTQESGGTTAQANTEVVTPKETTTTTTTTPTATQNQNAAASTATTTTTTTTPTATSGTRSAAYEKAMATLKQAQSQAPTYTSSYDTEINEIYNKITNREPFKYDYSSDPLYNQYRESYTQQGKQAMIDSQAQTAALTGGYGNSYGSAVGQQQYDAYLSRLNDVLPELYGQAYDMYTQEANNLQNQYNLLLDRENSDYERYRNALSDYRYDLALDEDRANQLAADLANYGDFSGYAELYGQDAADIMAKTWATANPLPAYLNGQIDEEEYYQITGEYPIGYTPPGSESSGGGGSGGTSTGKPGPSLGYEYAGIYNPDLYTNIEDYPKW